MPYRHSRGHFPDPDTRREHLQVINVYTHAQTDLTPADPAPAAQVLAAMLPQTGGQLIPRIGERVPYDDNPDLRDV